MIHFNQDVCGNLDAALQREWLETNGLGRLQPRPLLWGLNTRRYHGLLVAATQPPVGRMLLLSKLEETLVLRDADGSVTHRYELSANQYPGTPCIRKVYRYLKDSFGSIHFPSSPTRFEGITLEKAVFMVQGENTVCVQYIANHWQQTRCQGASLQVRPLIAFRDFHATTHQNDALERARRGAARMSWQRCGRMRACPRWASRTTPTQIDATGLWFRDFEYAVERERGLDFREDLFSPFALTFRFDGAPRQCQHRRVH